MQVQYQGSELTSKAVLAAAVCTAWLVHAMLLPYSWHSTSRHTPNEQLYITSYSYLAYGALVRWLALQRNANEPEVVYSVHPWKKAHSNVRFAYHALTELQSSLHQRIHTHMLQRAVSAYGVTHSLFFLYM